MVEFGWGEGHISPGSSGETREDGWAFCRKQAAVIVGKDRTEANAIVVCKMDASTSDKEEASAGPTRALRISASLAWSSESTGVTASQPKGASRGRGALGNQGTREQVHFEPIDARGSVDRLPRKPGRGVPTRLEVV